MDLQVSDNLVTLHAEEERLRAMSLRHIEANAELRDHLQIIREAMNIIWGLTHDHQHKSDDQLTIQFLGIRLFNAASSSVKLALSGYYQNAFQVLRDLLETYFLLDYLRSNPAQIPIWKAADKKQLIARFGPSAIRAALDKRDGYKGGKRKEHYDLLSSLATHASNRGFRLTTRSALGEIGPFFDDSILLAWTQEMAKILVPVALVYGRHFEGLALELLLVKAKYLQDAEAWRMRHYAS
jgi:hypothetical protein